MTPTRRCKHCGKTATELATLMLLIANGLKTNRDPLRCQSGARQGKKHEFEYVYVKEDDGEETR